MSIILYPGMLIIKKNALQIRQNIIIQKVFELNKEGLRLGIILQQQILDLPPNSYVSPDINVILNCFPW